MGEQRLHFNRKLKLEKITRLCDVEDFACTFTLSDQPICAASPWTLHDAYLYIRSPLFFSFVFLKQKIFFKTKCSSLLSALTYKLISDAIVQYSLLRVIRSWRNPKAEGQQQKGDFYEWIWTFTHTVVEMM